MSNAAVQYDADELTPVELDRPRHLIFTVAAFREVCRKTGEKDLRKAITSLLESQIEGMLILGCAALRHEWPDVDEDKLAAILTPKRLPRFQVALRTAMNGGKDDAAEESPAGPPTASGSSS